MTSTIIFGFIALGEFLFWLHSGFPYSLFFCGFFACAFLRDFLDYALDHIGELVAMYEAKETKE